MSRSLAGKVCVVTGGSRGIGRAVALQLAEHGATVYITSRTLHQQPGVRESGSLTETAADIARCGGSCVPVVCDHNNDEDTAALFEQVRRENDGQLDILVNNAFAGNRAIFEYMGTPFWEAPTTMWDTVNRVGLRNHYLCAVHGARLMTAQKSGLIINISSAGGLSYMFNVAYGVGKAGCDRMAADCAEELRQFGVAFVSLWPGPACSESSLSLLRDNIHRPAIKQNLGLQGFDDEQAIRLFESLETAELTGKCIVALAGDVKLMMKSGKTLLTCDLLSEYGLQDEAGHRPMDPRLASFCLQQAGYHTLARLVPTWLRIPRWVMYLSGYRF